mmetsp:Transcript_31799/g.69580  ORF Transcript_31799/g.69580 Transcript_31799/m.69580 type:complete len:346 (+) Transcript_31799:335-1372(+)
MSSLRPSLLPSLPVRTALCFDAVYLLIFLADGFLEHLPAVLLTTALAQHIQLLVLGLEGVQLTLELEIPFLLSFVFKQAYLNLLLVVHDGLTALLKLAVPFLFDQLPLHHSLEGPLCILLSHDGSGLVQLHLPLRLLFQPPLMLLHLALEVVVIVPDGQLHSLLLLHLLFHVLLALCVLLALKDGHALHVPLFHTLKALTLAKYLLLLGLLLALFLIKLLLHHAIVPLNLLAPMLRLPLHLALHLLLLPLELRFCELAVQLQLQSLLLTLLVSQFSPPIVELSSASRLLFKAFHLHVIVALHHRVAFLRVPKLLELMLQSPRQPLFLPGLHQLQLLQLLLHCPVL